ncbi:hypothetical protein PF010_g30899 [Phytophthora fragariae]|uniref:Alcohol dehydrogenase-like C-terminal domain-containing protein n=3 Tax=Phytophthora fragariae TaxID=53985 RepID=A0A6G0JJ38_9STRA|nr:hypothetical protein PF010_g30899 [Phytophthora fragariae]
MVGLPNDDVKFSPFFIVPRAVRVRGSCIGSIGSIQDIKDMLELASKENVRPMIQKLPMSKVNEGLDMVRDGRVRYRVVFEN